jgi:alkylhydroperoxidase family enzyme
MKEEPMARIEPLPPEKMKLEARAALEGVQARRSEMTRLMATLARRPALMTTLAAHLEAVFETGTVEPRLKEMLAVRVSQINDCAY